MRRSIRRSCSARSREGHEIGNHSWSHPNLGENVRRKRAPRDYKRTDDAIKSAIGVAPHFDAAALRLDHARGRNVGSTMSSVIALSSGTSIRSIGNVRARVSLRSRILKETRPGSIVLAHDIHPPTIEAMPATFDRTGSERIQIRHRFRIARMLRCANVRARRRRKPSALRSRRPSPSVAALRPSS